ncbi:major capsid protein [Gordonia soli]|uniref:Major capsid protein n=1 Tax=Gordonia soli NBRC 108243 TaxID=1223545 RepID=M0QQ76_9ACTN|nr:major capsid protein [Gordonia soli]GAC70733.1 hypothetical protein GS4_39_00640 [Gordonia soli NBRC 108243]
MPGPTPVTYPIGPPVVTNNQITVDLALNQPNLITRRIRDITLQSFIAPLLFTSSGQTVVGGAMRYQQAKVNELYTNRDVEQRGPGDEYPNVGVDRLEEKLAKVEDWGGKFPITDEAKKRNDVSTLNQATTSLANTIVRKVNTRTVAVLEAAIADQAGAGTFIGKNWSTAVTNGVSPTANNALPQSDFAKAQLLADQDELGVRYNLWIVNPQEAANLATTYGSALKDLLDYYNVELFQSNRVTAGTAYVAEKGAVGFLDYEEGLSTETWREPNRKSWYIQSWVLPIMGVTNPYSVRKVTGLAG